MNQIGDIDDVATTEEWPAFCNYMFENVKLRKKSFK